jgi:Virulence factor membrane-bound polymerase, C-terminal/O-Antigen ligase
MGVMVSTQSKISPRARVCLLAVPLLAFCLPFDNLPSRLVQPWLVCLLGLGLIIATVPVSRLPKPFTLGFLSVAALLLFHGVFIKPHYMREVIISGLGLIFVYLAAMAGVSIAHRQQWSLALAIGLLAAALLNCVLGTVQMLMPAGHWLEIFIKPLLFYSMNGNLGQYNLFAALIIIGFFSLVYICEVSENWKWRNTYRYSTICIAFFALVLVSSVSRSRIGLVFWFIAWLAGWVLRRRLNHVSQIILLCSFPLVVGLGQVIAIGMIALTKSNSTAAVAVQQSHIANVSSALAIKHMGETTGSGRTLHAQDFFSIFLDNLWTGTGWGSAATVHFENAERNKFLWGVYLDNTHNVLTHLTLELGAPIGGFIIALVLYGICRAKPWNVRQPEQALAWSILGILSVYSLTEFPYFHGPFILTIGVCLGMVSIAPMGEKKLQRDSQVNKVQLIIAGLIAAFAVTALNYYHQLQQRKNNPNNTVMAWLFHRHIEAINLAQIKPSQGNARELLERNLRHLEYLPDTHTIERIIELAQLANEPNIASRYDRLFALYYPQRYIARKIDQSSQK